MDADKEDDGEAGIDEADDEKKWSHYTGPYFLQPLLDNVQLADGDDRDSSITCLELWGTWKRYGTGYHVVAVFAAASRRMSRQG